VVEFSKPADGARSKCVVDDRRAAGAGPWRIRSLVRPKSTVLSADRVEGKNEVAVNVEELEIPEVKIITPRKFGDNRGFFSETYNRDRLADAGIDLEFVQDNHSFSAPVGTLRGLHFQIPPFAQDKLVRVVRGAIWDVAVDIRHGSPTFGRWVAREISAEAWNQILVPVGFAHGFCTIEPDTEVIYKVSAPYAPDHERGIMWNDPDLKITWPLDGRAPILSGKDAENPSFADTPEYFSHEAP
jgi:dTDP-4-dehydrorhamnose 3,5-epimerase